MQTPDWHVSVFVHPLASLHVVPFGFFASDVHATLAADIDDFAWQLRMHVRELAGAAFMQDAGQADHGVGIGDYPLERSRIVHVGVDDIDGRQHDQSLRSLTPTRGHAHADTA